MSEKLVNALVNMKEAEAVQLTKDLLASGEDPMKVLAACQEAMDNVGKRFEKGEYFLPELIMAGEMLNQISDIISQNLKVRQRRSLWERSLSVR